MTSVCRERESAAASHGLREERERELHTDVASQTSKNKNTHAASRVSKGPIHIKDTKMMCYTKIAVTLPLQTATSVPVHFSNGVASNESINLTPDQNSKLINRHKILPQSGIYPCDGKSKGLAVVLYNFNDKPINLSANLKVGQVRYAEEENLDVNALDHRPEEELTDEEL